MLDIDTPVNGTIYIGAPDGDEDLARAVTIQGATGIIRAWHYRNGSWKRIA
jgi:hypothetical protein